MKIASLKEAVSAEEWKLRVDLAAAYRLVAAYGWSDLVHGLLRIGFSKGFFPSPWPPEHGSTRRPMRLNLSLDAGGDLLGVDSPAEKRLSRAPSTGYPLSPGLFHRSRNHSDAADSSGPARRAA